jgi:hypothetical protein
VRNWCKRAAPRQPHANETCGAASSKGVSGWSAPFWSRRLGFSMPVSRRSCAAEDRRGTPRSSCRSWVSSAFVAQVVSAPVPTCCIVRETPIEQDDLSICPNNGKLRTHHGVAPCHLTIFSAHCDIRPEQRLRSHRGQTNRRRALASDRAIAKRCCKRSWVGGWHQDIRRQGQAIRSRWPRCTTVQSDPGDPSPLSRARLTQVLPSNHR